MRVKGVRIFTIFSIILSMWSVYVTSIEESFCFGSGYDNLYQRGNGLKSMGATVWYNYPLNTLWGANHMPMDLKAPDAPELTIKRVRGPAADGTLKDLNGWLELKLFRKKPRRFQAIAVWAVTDKMETFGRFVSMPNLDCKDGSWHELSFVPCSATPVNSASNPNMFFWTAIPRGSSIVSPIRRNLFRLLWKADTSFCNMPKEFMFVIAVAGKEWNQLVLPVSVFDAPGMKLGPYLFASSKLSPKFYGVASPIFDKQKLQCKLTDEVSTTRASWMKSLAPIAGVTNLDQKYYDDRWLPNGSEQLKVISRRSICKAKGFKFVDFGGRCLGANWDAQQAGKILKGSLSSPPLCLNYSMTIETSDFATKFEQSGSGPMHFLDYMKVPRKSSMHRKPCNCPPIPTRSDVSKARSLSWHDAMPYIEPERGCKEYLGKPEYHIHGLCLISVAGQYALGVRQWHAITSLFCCMVLIPISCFVARYLKGTIPNSHATGKPHLPIRAWYLIHICLVLPVISVFASGMSSINRQLQVLGASRSDFARFHRTCGYPIMSVYGILCIFGFLRPLKKLPRKIFIYLHWGLGYIVNYFGVVVCILTYRIPASPFSFRKLLDPNFKKIYYHFAPLFVMIWLILDVLVHTCMTVYIKSYDKVHLNVGVSSYFPVILPLRVDSYYLRTHDYDDLAHEDHCLMKSFFCYCWFCLVFFGLTLIAMTYLNFEANHGYGVMECTHDSNNFFTAGSGNITDEELKHRQKFCQI